MSRAVDLNSDMGEAFGPWRMGDDSALLRIVTSANIACGFHAGDADVMAACMAEAVRNGVGIGAHPGFADLKGFGRRRLTLPADELRNLIAYQVAAAQGMARAAGGRLRHVKLHGALNNMASEDEELCLRCFDAALAIDPDLVMVGLSGTAMERAATRIGCAFAGEIFADRAYRADATLAPRGEPGAVIHDAEEAAERVFAMLAAGAILTPEGVEIPARIDTICVHGDTPGAVAAARTLRQRLEGEGYVLRPL